MLMVEKPNNTSTEKFSKWIILIHVDFFKCLSHYDTSGLDISDRYQYRSVSSSSAAGSGLQPKPALPQPAFSVASGNI